MRSAKKGERVECFAMGVCMGVLLLFCLSIAVRFCTRQILVKRMGVDNAFTRLVFWDRPNAAHQDDLNDRGEASIAMNWAELFPFEVEGGYPAEGSNRDSVRDFVNQNMGSSKADLYIQIVDAFKEKMGYYSGELLAGYFWLIRGHYWYNFWIDWKTAENGVGRTLYMENGYLTYKEAARTPDEISEMADSVEAFSDYLKEEGIAFYYVNAGSKVNPRDRQLSPGNRRKEFTNENGDALLKALSDRGVNTLDMREYMLDEGLDWYSYYYRTDHHWTTEAGLWAAGVIAKVLNEREGFSFDQILFDEESYDMATYEGCILGSQGCAVLSADRDSYTYILPRFDTDLVVEIPSRGVQLAGTYRDTLYNYGHLENALQYSEIDHLTKPNAYHSTTWRNDALGIVKNKNAGGNAGRKLLVVQDSFSWYSTTYLACGVGETHMINLSEFTGSLRAYVKEMKPDVVLVMYHEGNIKPIDWNVHDSHFDFR